VVGELLGDLVERGLDFITPRLYVLDGGKALTSAVKKYAGESAAIQRCQVHKRRNVLDHLSDEQKPGVAKKLNAAYALEDYAAAKQASIVEQVCRNVKRWHGSDQRERWVGSGLLVAEKQFRRVQGYKQIPALIKELEALAPSKSVIVKRRKAS
jgi:hypothetical protein